MTYYNLLTLVSSLTFYLHADGHTFAEPTGRTAFPVGLVHLAAVAIGAAILFPVLNCSLNIYVMADEILWQMRYYGR